MVSSLTANRKLWILFAGLLGLIYLLNVLTPLRLTTDTVRYFELAERMNGTWPAHLIPRNDFFPYGYVVVLAALSKLGLLSSFTICLLNCLYLAGSIQYVIKIFSDRINKTAFVIYVLLSWIFIKTTLLPLAEMQALFFTCGSLWYFHQYVNTKKAKYILLSVLFCGISIFTRTAGVALLAALLVSFLIIHRRQIIEWIRQRMIISITLFALVLLGIILVVMSESFIVYVDFLTRPLKKDPVSFFATNIHQHLIEWGEVIINVPFSKLSLYMSAENAQVLYMGAGIVSFFIIGKFFFNKALLVPIHIRVYVIIYLLLIFNWPFFAARFWIPVIPLIAAGFLNKRIALVGEFTKNATRAYKIYFILTGLLALGYYSWLSFNKEELARRQEEGAFHREYEKHFFKREPQDTLMKERALYILEKYD